MYFSTVENNQNKLRILIAVKKTLIGLNLVTWFCGCIFASMGIWLRIDSDLETLIEKVEYIGRESLASTYHLATYFFIVIGVLISLVCFLGSIAITKENESWLIIYSFFMLFTLGLYSSVAIWGFVRLDYLKGIVSDAMRDLFNLALMDEINEAKYAVIELQFQFKCCGNIGPQEYGGDVPPVCGANLIGCNQACYDFYSDKVILMSIISLIFGLFQISNISFSIYLANEFKKARFLIRKMEENGLIFL